MTQSDGKSKSVLIAASGQRAQDALAGVLRPPRFGPVVCRGSAAEARRLLVEVPFSLVFINTPLPDEYGTELALDLARDAHCGVALFVSADVYEQTCSRVEDAGVITVARPCSAQAIRQAAGMLSAARARIAALEARAVSLEEKMAEIRVVNRAKWALIDRRGLTEAAAHRLIEQAAMNGRMTSADAARRILAELAPEDKI